MSSQISDWHGAYRQGWGRNRLLPASFAHPAKNSYGLSVRIYEHALEEGWIEPGGIVLDPFAGIGGFALEAMRHGLHFRGVELEMRFCDMGQGCDCTGINKADWVRFQGRWGKARYNDGRHWCPECIMKAAAVAGEREFKVAKKRKIKPLPLPGTKWGALAKACQATLLNATPTTPTASYVRNSGKIPCTGEHHYRGNIETWEAQGMPGTARIVQGDSRRLGEVLAEARLCLSSPPWANTLGTVDGNEEFWQERERRWGSRVASPRRKEIDASTYGDTEGNLGNLPNTGFEAALALGSPPYAGSLGDGKSGIDWSKQADRETAHAHGWDGENYGQQPGQLAQMPVGDLALACERPTCCLSSPPFQGSLSRDNVTEGRVALAREKGVSVHLVSPVDMEKVGKRMQNYNAAAGQLAALPEGSHAEACEQPAIVVSSPPWQSGTQSVSSMPVTGELALKCGGTAGGKSAHPVAEGYGSAEGQLGQMPPGSHAEALEAGAETGRVEACISSPPWEKSLLTTDTKFMAQVERDQRNNSRLQPGLGDYGDTAGQLGQQQGSTFWAASRQILEEVYQVLAPGGHCIFVCKRFVRDKKIVEFSAQWARLCEAVGFKWIHHHKAWLVEDRGAQHTLEGGLEERQVKRMSFFRRLHAAKYPHLEILYEDVLCFVKEA